MPIKPKANHANIDLKAPIKQVGGKVDSVNGMTGDVVLDIPSKTSQLENDSDFATSAAVSNTEERINYKLGSYALKTEIPDVEGLATKSEVKAVEKKIPSIEGLASTQYVDDKVAAIVVPSLDGYATEQWVEGKGYLTQHQSLADYALKNEIPTVPTNVSTFTNDSGYLTIATLPKYDGGVE